MNDAGEQVILVDEHDTEIGLGAKLDMHERGILHRAFSIYVFNDAGELLLQKRAAGKYHSGGVWANTCCGHPRHGEENSSAAHRRLQEEMGFDCPLQEIPSTVYRAGLGRGMVEHEFLHVFIGRFNGTPAPDPKEAEDVAWVSLEQLQKDIAAAPERYSQWLKICLPHVIKHASA
jgi:isopentenyl-diphosphate Delta-isomerase